MSATDDLTRLRELAQKVNKPNRPWGISQRPDWISGDDVDFIRTCSPLRILSLIDRVEELEGALRRIGENNGNYAECLPECIEGPPTCGCAEDWARQALQGESDD